MGSTTAFSLITQGICDEVLMIDINKERAYGEMLDLQDSIEYLNRNVKVRTGEYSDCGDADIIVITAGAPPKQGQTRLDTLELSAKICKSIVDPIMQSGFDGIFLVISNPVDIIAHYVYSLSGLPKNQVIGTGTAIDSARLQNMIAQLIKVDPRSVHAYSMGEHGDSQVSAHSKAYRMYRNGRAWEGGKGIIVYHGTCKHSCHLLFWGCVHYLTLSGLVKPIKWRFSGLCYFHQASSNCIVFCRKWGMK